MKAVDVLKLLKLSLMGSLKIKSTYGDVLSLRT